MKLPTGFEMISFRKLPLGCRFWYNEEDYSRSRSSAKIDTRAAAVLDYDSMQAYMYKTSNFQVLVRKRELKLLPSTLRKQRKQYRKVTDYVKNKK